MSRTRITQGNLGLLMLPLAQMALAIPTGVRRDRQKRLSAEQPRLALRLAELDSALYYVVEGVKGVKCVLGAAPPDLALLESRQL